MPKKLRFQALSGSKRDYILVFILLFNTITWYFMTLMWTNSSISVLKLGNIEALVLTFYNAAIILAGLAGSIFSPKIARIRFLSFWMLFGALVSWLLVSLNLSGTVYVVVLYSLLGASFGFGLPSCFSYFADHTLIENRGTIAGIILLISNFITIPIAFSFIVLNLDLATISFICGFWRFIGLILFLSLKPEEKTLINAGKASSFDTVFSNRPFLLYVLPWLMFSLVNGLEEPVVKHSLGTEVLQNITIAAPLIGGVSALIGGVFADRKGRKCVVMIGFITLGLAYAVLSLAPQEIMAQYLYGFVDALGGGFFLALFFLVLWGDLSETGTREKFYAVGTAFNYLTFIMRQISYPYIQLIQPNAAFSLAAFFLFLAVLPLMYAPQTLPEKKIELRRLKGYIEQAKKITNKYTQKDNGKS
jgi:MFS family permease